MQDTKVQDAVTTITRYRYDPNGNQVEKHTETISPKTSAGHTMGYTGAADVVELREYNGLGQLARVYTGGTTATYRYTPQGLRFEKTVDGRKETHLWCSTKLVAELNESGDLLAKNIRGIGLLARYSDNKKLVYHFNAHGDVVQFSLYNSQDICYYDYDAFGVERNRSGDTANPFRYCGEYFDTETNTVYLRARYYRPAIGRFLCADPARDGLNWHTYCGNNPVAFADPSGRTKERPSLKEFIASLHQSQGSKSGTGLTANGAMYKREIPHGAIPPKREVQIGPAAPPVSAYERQELQAVRDSEILDKVADKYGMDNVIPAGSMVGHDGRMIYQFYGCKKGFEVTHVIKVTVDTRTKGELIEANTSWMSSWIYDGLEVLPEFLESQPYFGVHPAAELGVAIASEKIDQIVPDLRQEVYAYDQLRGYDSDETASLVAYAQVNEVIFKPGKGVTYTFPGRQITPY